ncbi:MAG TPA: DUF4189 domain-containing protein [Hyphomicrobiaceae bacterium]|nr:DUF4189 domain-containing protein [Hyphomicrobiaceae bacterium]
MNISNRYLTLVAALMCLASIAVALTATPAMALSLEEALRRAEVPKGSGTPTPALPQTPPTTRPPTGQLAPPGGNASGGRSSSRRWGAFSVALWKRRGIAQVSIGSALKFASKAEAQNAALRQCRDAGGRSCKIVTTWSVGCGYITTGRNSRGAGWVARTTRAKTTRDCRARGYRCKPPIGGCVD